MISVTKDFTFDAAHRLVRNYDGKCAHLHGHTYHVYITVALRSKEQASMLSGSEEPTLDQYGFVEDFDKIKIVKRWVDENWDHATIVNHEDTLLLLWLSANKQKKYPIFIGNGNPTVENMCKVLFGECVKQLSTDRVYVHEVKIYETPTSCASYSESN